MRIASLDLGTNTFNLLIADVCNGQLTEIVRLKKAVKIGKGGIHKHTITPEAFSRGIEAIQDYIRIITEYKVDKVLAIATSAIRGADNGLIFTQELKKIFNIDVQIISGEQEAEYIFHGISHAVSLNDQAVLMLDIGGGSNELIVGNKKGIIWKESLPLGIARLLELFRPSDPISIAEIETIQEYIDPFLQPFKEILAQYPVSLLAGSSGSFDTLANMISFSKTDMATDRIQKSFTITLEDFRYFYDEILRLNTHDRLKIKGMDPMRVEMMPLAVVFIDYIIRITNIKQLVQSSYAIKEGVIFAYLNQ